MTWDWNEVDGVATLSARAGAIQGPLQACLVFGVGRTDETMPVAGITHLVEHLAFQPMDHTPYSVNGTVDLVATRFTVSGQPEDAVEFFRAITQNLRNLPTDGLAHECRVLQVEERRSSGSHAGFDLSSRFGPRGAGLVGWPEHGLKRIDADEVRAWAETWFTVENAALWTSGPLPEGLDLSALPHGTKPSHAAMPDALRASRTFAVEPTQVASVSAITDMQIGVVPGLQIAHRRAYDRIRRRDALSYGITFEVHRLDAGHGYVSLCADGAQGQYQGVFEGLVAVWEELLVTGPKAEEWDDVRRAYFTQLDSPQARVANLDHDAERHVLGLRYITDEEHREHVEVLTADEIRADLGALTPTLGAVVPCGVDAGTTGWTEYEAWSVAPVAGDIFHPIEGREQGTVVLGDDGVSWIAPDDRVHSIRWDDAICAFTWDDDRRTVLGPTGEWVTLIPWCWRGGSQFPSRVDGALDERRRIRLGEGETQYLRDPADPESTTDVRWLGSIVGARYRGDGVDVVIDTDGFFLLFSNQTKESTPLRLQFLSQSDRGTLLGADSRNRWVPQSDIELVELTMNARARLRGARRVLLVKLRDGSSLDIHLVTTQHVEIVSHQFRRMLGPYFQA